MIKSPWKNVAGLAGQTLNLLITTVTSRTRTQLSQNARLTDYLEGASSVANFNTVYEESQ